MTEEISLTDSPLLEGLAANGSSPSNDNLWTALLAVQSEAIRLQKDAEADIQSRSGRSYKYKYLTLAKLTESVLPVLTRHGLLWRTLPVLVGEKSCLAYSMRHVSSGESEDGVMTLALSGSAGPQEQGSGISFARRYALMAVLNLVPLETDDDGRHAQATEEHKLSAGQRVKITDALKGVAQIGLFLSAAGVSTDPDDWTRGDALKIRRALDAQTVTA